MPSLFVISLRDICKILYYNRDIGRLHVTDSISQHIWCRSDYIGHGDPTPGNERNAGSLRPCATTWTSGSIQVNLGNVHGLYENGT